MGDALTVVERASAYFWSVSHVAGSVVMAYGWRKYRQKFFAWMTLTWTFQTFGGVTRELFSPDAQTALRIALRLLITLASFAAFYHGLILVRRKSTVTVVGLDDLGRLRVREGVEDRLLDVGPTPPHEGNHDRTTERPPRN